MNSGDATKILAVPEGIEPVRLDKYLADRADLDLSRTFVQQLIAAGRVIVDGETPAKKLMLKGGENIALAIPPPEVPDLSPEEIPLDIVYNDEYLAVVNKPSGLVTHPAPGNPGHTLVNALMYHFKTLAEDDTGLRPGIIHRLDKNTSGLLIVAKNDQVARRLREQLAARRIVKIYHAVVCGHMAEQSGIIDLPVGRSLKDRKKMAVTAVRSRQAVTHYRVLDRFRLNDLVEIRLETGRTHQIRVHFSHLHRPVLGDPDYGGRQKWLKGIDPSRRRAGRALLGVIDRQALHAKSLVFTHPITGEETSVDSELPEDMRRLITVLERDYR